MVWGKYVMVGAAHLSGVALVLQFLRYVLPCCVTGYYWCAAHLLMCLVVANFTFGFTKRKFLSDRIQPDNRAVLITGCDSGFGHELAKTLDEMGYQVFASCLFPSGPGAADLQKSSSSRLQVLELDVTKDESVKNAVKYVKQNIGTSELWAIVNNAGIFKGFTAELTPIQEYKDVMEVNAFGMVRVTKAFLPLLRQSKGRVVNITSLAGKLSTAYMSTYTMSKHAAVAFTTSLRQEMSAWGVKVISIEPEFFRTHLTTGENIERCLDQTFASIEPETLADYGEKYLEHSKEGFINFINGITSHNIHKVINAIVLAITLEHPSASYEPDRNCLARVFRILARNTPQPLQDLIVDFRHYIAGQPKPKEAGNSL